MEISQFTYFQQAGGIDCRPVTAEMTYGLERVAMYLQGVDSVYDLAWTDGPVTYGDVHLQNEQEMSAYNFTHAPVDTLFDWFETCEAESRRLAEYELPLPAYEMVLKASHVFNLLDARRGALGDRAPALPPAGADDRARNGPGLAHPARAARLPPAAPRGGRAGQGGGR